MAGPGLVMNPGVGRRITTDAGSITTMPGPGARVVDSSRSAVGGVLRWSRLYSTYRSETTSAGIHCRITSATRIPVTIAGMTIVGTTIVDRAMDETDETDDTITTGHAA